MELGVELGVVKLGMVEVGKELGMELGVELGMGSDDPQQMASS